MAENPYPYDTGRVRELLKSKRKARGIRACFPCRHRKVRCDGQSPCSSCVERGHSELCRMPASAGQEPRSQSAGPGPNSGPDLGAISSIIEDTQAQASVDPRLMISRLEKIEEQIASLKADLSRTPTVDSARSSRALSEMHQSNDDNKPEPSLKRSQGRRVVEDPTGATIYLGNHADAPLALGTQASAAGDAILSDGLLDQFVPRAYPFTTLWGLEANLQNVCETFPDDSDVIRYWQTYNAIVYPFYPALVTREQFSQTLFSFLEQRALSKETNGHPVEPDGSWLALVFAVLACGVQFSDDPVKERDLRSRVFICSSFQCLRLSNFFNNTNIDQIQAMALIGQCLRNNLDTNSAWILMGSTIRLAQSIGLHEPYVSLSPLEKSQHNRLWWTLLWQDTLLSFTYDRPPSSVALGSSITFTSSSEGLSFEETVVNLCRIVLERRWQETYGPSLDPVQSILDFKQQLEELQRMAAPFLNDKNLCVSLQQHLERLALGIHYGYVACRFIRSYMEATGQPFSDYSAAAAECLQRAKEVVENFLTLHRLSANACRSWAFVQNVVSCAITLKTSEKTLPEESRNHEVLLQRLISVLEKEEKESEWIDADTNIRHFGPYSRALKALRRVYKEE